MNQETEYKLNKLRNVYDIKEFQPIVEMCREWLSQRDESKYEKTNEDLLKESMNTIWLPMGWTETYTCKWVTKFDIMEDNHKSKVWKICVNEYLKSQ